MRKPHGDPSTRPNHRQLPSGYVRSGSIDTGSGHIAGVVQAIAGTIVAAMVSVAVLTDFPPGGSWGTGTTIVAIVSACVVYAVLHELTHGVVLRLLTGVRPTYAVRLPYLATGSDAYLGRSTTVVVALAPALVWGAVLVVLLLALPDLLLSTYVVAGLNFAGSAADYAQAWAAGRYPPTARFRDAGKATAVFLPGE